MTDHHPAGSDETVPSERGDPSMGFWGEAHDAPSMPLPKTIGRYRILEVIGAGGMGVVYRAEQENPRRTVALKVIRPGVVSPSTIRRFESEAQLLGRLQHPGIAQVFEAGVADAGAGKQPFFAMEYIDGAGLAEFCVNRRYGPTRRLELMARICDAVQHAHQKGVIHRDLKPGNIIVDDHGQPKVLDFGVARATDADLRTTTARTDVGQLVGTLAYMSPEQVAARPDELDTRSDVYALGVMLYELLAQRLPYDVTQVTLPEAARVITERDPTPLSSYDKSFRGDIETIAAKAMEKDRERRYASASELAADIRRFLSNEPIVARPASAIYQLRKFAGRNRTLVSGVVAVFVVLVLGVAGTTIGMLRAEKSRQFAEEQRLAAEAERNRAIAAEALAEQEAENARRESEKTLGMFHFLEDLLVSADPAVSHGTDLTIREALDRAADRIDTELADQPETQAAIHNTVGNIYQSLGLFAEAERHMRQSLEARRVLFGASHKSVLVSMNNLGNLLGVIGELDESIALLRAALEKARETHGNEDPEVAANLVGLGSFLRQKGDLDGAEEALLEVIGLLRSTGSDQKRLAFAINNLAAVHSSRGEYVAAEELYNEALELMRQTIGNQHPEYISTLSNLSVCLDKRAAYAESEPLIHEVMEYRRRVLPEGHIQIANAANNYAALLRKLERIDEAEALFREALDIYREVHGPDHTRVAVALNNLAGVLRSNGKLADAEAMYQETLAILRGKFGDEHRYVAGAINNLASVLYSLNKLDEAEKAFMEVAEMQRRLVGERHALVGTAYNNVGGVLHDKKRYEEAERYYRLAIEIRQEALGPTHPGVATTLASLGALKCDTGDFEQAENMLVEAAQIQRDALGDKNRQLAETLYHHAKLMLEDGRTDLAIETAEHSLEMRRELLPERHWKIGYSQYLLAKCYVARERNDDAVPLLRSGVDILVESKGAEHAATVSAVEAMIDVYERTDRASLADPYRAMIADRLSSDGAGR